MKAQADRAAITQEEIISRLAAIVRADIRQLYDERGALRPVHTLPDEVAAALDSVETQEVYEGGEVVGVTRKVKRADRLKAAELLMRHMGMLNDKLTLKGRAQDPLALLIQQVQGSYLDPVRTPASQ